ncbi:hypothetical protein KCG47_17505 [Microvirga sp. SRT04]|uniref:Transposase n=1 Tax=Hymenobacter properus TaxID=2791026 RepID=A0A931FPB1_9BACT|nr:hypothetical protein [Hymenobacter properus]MBR7722257.1 hypothetical protein [Microvirga sp. SRT04]
MPAAWGNLHSTYTRLQRWTSSGMWARVLAAVQAYDALPTFLVDSTTVQAHQHASGARKKRAASPRAQPRWLDHEGTCRGRRPRPVRARRPDGRPAPRRKPCRCSTGWPRPTPLPTAVMILTRSWRP